MKTIIITIFAMFLFHSQIGQSQELTYWEDFRYTQAYDEWVDGFRDERPRKCEFTSKGCRKTKKTKSIELSYWEDFRYTQAYDEWVDGFRDERPRKCEFTSQGCPKTYKSKPIELGYWEEFRYMQAYDEWVDGFRDEMPSRRDFASKTKKSSKNVTLPQSVRYSTKVAIRVGTQTIGYTRPNTSYKVEKVVRHNGRIWLQVSVPKADQLVEGKSTGFILYK